MAHARGGVQAQHGDRQVAGDAEPPQRRLAQAVGGEDVLGGAQAARRGRSGCPARRWNRWTSSARSCVCCSSIRACAQASSKTRVTACVAWYWSASATAASRDGGDARGEGDDDLLARPHDDRAGGSPRPGRGPAPVVPLSRRLRPGAAGSAGERRRPRNCARSVSHCTGPPGASEATTWTAQIGAWSGVRGRRRHRIAVCSGSHSVSTNSLPNAGWARSAACGARTTSA